VNWSGCDLDGWKAFSDALKAAGFERVEQRTLEKLCTRSRAFPPHVGLMPIRFDGRRRTANKAELVDWMTRARAWESSVAAERASSPRGKAA